MKSCQVVWVTKVDPVWERQGERVLFILCWLQQPWEYLDLFIFACVNIRQWVYFPWKCFMDCKRQRGGEREERVVEGRKLRTKSWTGANNPTTARKGEVSSLFLFFFLVFGSPISSRKRVHASSLYYLSVVALWLVGRIHFICVCVCGCVCACVSVSL